MRYRIQLMIGDGRRREPRRAPKPKIFFRVTYGTTNAEPPARQPALIINHGEHVNNHREHVK